MFDLNNILNESSPSELREFVSPCVNTEELVSRLENNPVRLFSFIQNMKIEGNESLAERLLYRVPLQELGNSVIKKVETVLRNCGLLNRSTAPDIALKLEQETAVFSINAHRAILALESRYFMGMNGFREFQQDEFEIEPMGISPMAYEKAVEYLYSSDEDRKEFASNVDKALLPDLARLADFWAIDELKRACDEELCNSIGELAIEKSDVEDWLSQSQFTPKFVQLLSFIKGQAEEGSLDLIIDEMQTPAGAARLAAKCTSEQIALFAELKTEFGKACQIPPGTFGKAEWESAFPVTIDEIPPLPPNIHAILEREDPYEPGKKLKDTCQLFLRPKKVILQEASGDKELLLGFDGVEELVGKAVDPARRSKYWTFNEFRDQMNRMPIAESGWVLMRKDVIPGSRGRCFEEQKELLKDSFEVPKLMDAVLLNILTFASEGKYLFGTNPWTCTRCQEMFGFYQTLVGGFDSSGLNVHDDDFGTYSYGLSGAWKF